MMYNKILSMGQGDDIKSQTKQEVDIMVKDDSLNSQMFKKQFNFLAETVLSLSSSISLNVLLRSILLILKNSVLFCRQKIIISF
ncbi:MAG: hypothetical protein CM15mP106_1460 [Candidatus Neomarinimicrobiota bacterium]|nr:MAG: hypothetical protein CM15mP106_1460 [Candidatus Neomarinimicrobiota bacterium]